MANEVTITAEADGKPLSVLQDLVKKRAAALGETTRDAVIATAINVVTSLKSSAKKAPLKANRKMYFNVHKAPFVAGWERNGGVYHRVARNGSNGSVNRDITRQCRNLVGPAYVPGENVGVWMFQLFNENPNKTVYYAFAYGESDVRKYAEKVILARLLKKESGMNRYALGIAQAKVSTRSGALVNPKGAKQMRIAYRAASVSTGGNSWTGCSGDFWMSVKDELRYAMSGLRKGRSSFDEAVKKASNKTAGLIHMAYVGKRFNEDVKTPFPEVKRRR